MNPIANLYVACLQDPSAGSRTPCRHCAKSFFFGSAIRLKAIAAVSGLRIETYFFCIRRAPSLLPGAAGDVHEASVILIGGSVVLSPVAAFHHVTSYRPG
jgi:hypothetical protein